MVLPVTSIGVVTLKGLI